MITEIYIYLLLMLSNFLYKLKWFKNKNKSDKVNNYLKIHLKGNNFRK